MSDYLTALGRKKVSEALERALSQAGSVLSDEQIVILAKAFEGHSAESIAKALREFTTDEESRHMVGIARMVPKGDHFARYASGFALAIREAHLTGADAAIGRRVSQRLQGNKSFGAYDPVTGLNAIRAWAQAAQVGDLWKLLPRDAQSEGDEAYNWLRGSGPELSLDQKAEGIDPIGAELPE